MTKKIILLTLILCAATIPAQAGKPTPPPYPAPGAGAQAYPPPGSGLPGPDLPDQPPQSGEWYSWGYLDTKWAVSKFPESFITDLQGVICVHWLGHSITRCYDLYFYGYNANTLTLSYAAGPDKKQCWKTWIVDYAFIDGEWATIREPNEYYVHCSVLPKIKAMLDWFPVPGL